MTAKLVSTPNGTYKFYLNGIKGLNKGIIAYENVMVYLFILCQWSLSIPHENIRKYLVF